MKKIMFGAQEVMRHLIRRDDKTERAGAQALDKNVEPLHTTEKCLPPAFFHMRLHVFII